MEALMVKKPNKEELSVGMELREYRLERGISLREASYGISDMSNDGSGRVSETYLSEIERGKQTGKTPSDEIIRNIARYYNLDEKYLFDRFNKVPLSVQNELRGHDRISRTLYEISNRKDITEEEKDKLYLAFDKLFKEHFRK